MLLLIFGSAVKAVPEGSAYIVERFGKYTGTLKPGLNFIVPLIDRAAYKINMRERKVAVRFPDLKTSDNQVLVGSADVRVEIIDAAKAVYETGNVDETLRLVLDTEMRKIVKALPMNKVLIDASGLDEALLSAAQAKAGEMGLQVNFIDVHKIIQA